MADTESKLTGDFRQMLSDLMAAQDLNARRLGQMAGVADTTIWRILKRERIPTLDMVERIMDGLGYDVSIEITPHWRER